MDKKDEEESVFVIDCPPNEAESSEDSSICALATISESSTIIPRRISANIPIIVRNSASVRGCDENLDFSYKFRKESARCGGLIKPIPFR
ncbi:predicted protein [Uncinocarpus reesii 1704]|uniref:Uncharacterized protein n=1 Tax=Uncinocarpus reesii (strain UAMH 1704) TaxID=336963 RepID=C4JS56_UNCRE|nr:uncharacterized protein UREG_05295 [Uncinocarpus reesii 1704]EEP80453.1 predicted protein [Uncinocarpus reesii 1704]